MRDNVCRLSCYRTITRVHVHVRRLARTNITVFPLAHESLRDVCDQVVAMQILSAAGKFRMRLEQLSADELQFAVEVMKVRMGNKLIRSSHSQELAALPQTRIIICTRERKKKDHCKLLSILVFLDCTYKA